jgi:hypothetical protein
VVEEKAIAIPPVLAKEKGTGQTEWADENQLGCGVVDYLQYFLRVSRT